MADQIAPAFWEPKAVGEPERGLFSVAEVHEGVDPHLLMGVQYETTRCTTGGLWDNLCYDGSQEKTFSTLYLQEGLIGAVYDGVECTTVGMDFDAIQEQLRDSLRPKAEFAVEQVLMSGSEESGVVVPSQASVTELIAQAEFFLGEEYGALGMLHMSPYTATYARAANLLIEPNNASGYVRTITGTPVAIGRGYGDLDASLWVTATGHVAVLLGPVIPVTTPPDRENKIVTMVEQPFVVVAECVNARFAVPG